MLLRRVCCFVFCCLLFFFQRQEVPVYWKGSCPKTLVTELNSYRMISCCLSFGVVHNTKNNNNNKPRRESESVNTKGDVRIGFCWYLHFLAGKQSRDPEVQRCGQKPDVISPREILPGVQRQAGSRTQKDRGNRSCSVQTVLLVFRKQPVPQGSNPSKVCLGNCVSLLSGMCSSV